MDQPTIFAIGGGGFDSDSSHGDKLDHYFLNLTGKKNPKICLVPTASGDSLLRIARFHRACANYNCRPTLLELYRPPSNDLQSYVMDQDAIFVSGGSTRNLLVLWREWGLDQALHDAWQNGILLGGVSAGANCWFDQCSTDSNFGELSLLKSLGWLPYTCCPHYDEEPARRPQIHRLLEDGTLDHCLAIDGGAGVLIQDTTPSKAVGSKPNTKAYNVTIQSGQVKEDPLPVEILP